MDTTGTLWGCSRNSPNAMDPASALSQVETFKTVHMSYTLNAARGFSQLEKLPLPSSLCTGSIEVPTEKRAGQIT